MGFAIALLFLMLPATSSAQHQLGVSQGTITDASTAVMPGVTVTVTNLDTGIARSTVTNETGLYRVVSLDPGRYKVTAELQGSRPATQHDVILSVGATLGVNFATAGDRACRSGSRRCASCSLA